MGRVLIGLILFSFLGCKTYYENKSGGDRPKKPKFKLAKSPYQLKKEDLIDTNSVYIKNAVLYYNGKAVIEERFIRFFSNGRCFFGSTSVFETKLTLQDLNRVNNYNTIGYYKLDGDKIEIETFRVGGQFGNTPYYNEMSAIIQNDSIAFVGRGENQIDFSIAKQQNKSFYVRRKVEGLTGTPDW